MKQSRALVQPPVFILHLLQWELVELGSRVSILLPFFYFRLFAAIPMSIPFFAFSEL
jgi:hypothetical protein